VATALRLSAAAGARSTRRTFSDRTDVKISVYGAGLVGRRTASVLARNKDHDVVLVSQTRTGHTLAGVTTAVGWPNPAAAGSSIVVLAVESSKQWALARRLVDAGTDVITTADDPSDVRQLWGLDEQARINGVSVVVGAAYSPGVSTLLASYLVSRFDQVTSISTAQFGTGGPACARQHHRAMSTSAHDVDRGLLRPTRSGTGRELVWFPDPVGAADCYRAGLSDPFLLHQQFPRVERIRSRQAATRRDRLTARMPMLRPPHAEGLVGAVWAEVRGRVDGRVEHRVLAATAPQATGAAAMAAAFCELLIQRSEGQSDSQSNAESRDTRPRRGAQSAATTRNLNSLLRHISNDVRLWTYDGSQVVTNFGVVGPTSAARKWRVPTENPRTTPISGRSHGR